MVTRAFADPSAISGKAMGFASSSAVVLCAMAALTKTDGSPVDVSTSSASRQSAAATAAS